MAKPDSEPASRSNGQKNIRKVPDTAKGPGDGKDAEVAQGGKRIGPGHWEQLDTERD
jgi:hypothetical protein